MDREESKGAYRVTLLFIVVALFALFLDRTQTAASHEELIELAGATSVHLELDKCELLYIEEPPREELLKIGFKEEDFATPFQLFEPNADGCARCAGGYKGRFPILETLPMTQRIRRMVVEGRPKDDIKAQAISDGMLTLRRVGVLNAMRGVTSVQEILRITQEH